jgi:hypothetical protein
MLAESSAVAATITALPAVALAGDPLGIVCAGAAYSTCALAKSAKPRSDLC